MPATPRSAADDEARQVASALTRQDLELVGTVPLEPTPEFQAATRGPAPASPVEATIEADLAPDESAVVLLEQDGLYAWHFDAIETSPPAGVPGTRLRGPRAGMRTVTFRLPLEGAARGPAKTRGWLSDLVVGRAQAFVFKFAGRFLLGHGAAFLERKVRTGWVSLESDDPSGWKDLRNLSSVKLPNDRPARILLFVHGTFSSTRGGFGALGATPWGRSLLAAARANYDAVLGFDHPTLSVDPLVNATALLRGLEARKWTQPAKIDAISHSRGGITLRSLIEYLLPSATLPVHVERAVFVGAVNGGTELAEPKNWRSLINVYTNLAAGACRAIRMFPQTAFAAALFEELLKSVGTLAKVLTEQAITEQAVPGLAAMQPTGAFITGLNETQPGQPTAAQSRYYAVTSDFRAALAIDSLKELPRQLLLALAGGAVDRLMAAANDLVVNTDSMTHIDPQAGTFIKDTLAFGQNGVVYHTNYYLQPQVTNALARWLELETPQVAAPAHLRGVVQGGAAMPVSVPACMDTNVLVALAEDSGAETLQRIRQKTPSYVVVERSWQGRNLHYAFQAEEVTDSIARQPDAVLMDSLGLHETDASPAGRMDNLPQPHAASPRPSTRRVVGLEGGQVLGVAEAGVAPTPLNELARQAGQVLDPKDDGTRVLARRLMPTFTARPHLTRAMPPALAAAPVPPAPPDHTRGVVRGGGGGDAGAAPGGAASAPLATAAAPPTVTCHFAAEMDDEVLVGETTSVDVTLSREVIQAVKKVRATGQAAVQADRKLIVELIPKKNFIAAGQTRLETPLPEPGSPAQYIFDVKATDVGDGEILVRIRQGMQPLAILTLRCSTLTTRTRPPVRRPQEVSVVETPQGEQPRHVLMIIEIERGGQKMYYFTLYSPSLGIGADYESKPLIGSREEFIKGVYEDIEERYLANKTDYDQFQQELRDVGGELWDELFPEKLQSTLWQWRDAIDSILVFSEEPFIPWELVHLKEPGKGLPAETRFFGQMGLVRWLKGMDWPASELHARAGRCRYVIPHYPHPDYVLTEAQQESDFLTQHFGAKAVDPHAGPLRALLETPGQFDLLHFACHGAADSGDIARAELLLEGRVDGPNYVTEKFRPSVIENVSGLVGADGVHPMVTLNACQASRAGYKMTSIGGFSRAFITKGAGMFVAALWSVGDAPARNFTEKLYERLLANDTLAQAANAARETARAAKEATWLAYTVYGNPHARLKR